MFNICEQTIVALEPKFKVSDDTSDHGKFSLVSVGQIDFDVVLTNIWVDPCKDFFQLIKKYHIFVDDKVSVVIGHSAAGIDDGFCVRVSLLGVVILFEFEDGFISEVVDPDFLDVGLCFSEYDFGSAFDVSFLSFAVEISFLF